MRISGRTMTCALAVSTLVVAASATANARTVDDSTLTPHTHFVVQPLNPDGTTPAPAAHGADIPNIDSVKATIRKYYNATSAGVADKTSSPYITELQGIQQQVLADLPDPAPQANLAVVLDADDTTLWTYDMEDQAMHFNFDPKVQNDEWVIPGKFPATPGMVDFVKEVEDRGYTVFGITGRGASQEQATLDNLAKVGYDEFDADNFYTKFATPETKPDYLDCHSSVDPNDDPAKCTTVEYKAGTRAHIESLGYTIALNIGDQYSDLLGGHAEKSVKLPNPTYYLPSPNIQGAPASDAALALPTEFDMAPDGSSGLTTPGDQIPNIDNVKAEIRAYYGATSAGIANKETSPYISEMASIASTWKQKLTNICTRAVKKKQHPAVVFDADDTTLWTYDMEDAAMKFNFDPTLQNTWVQEGRFPATPRMPGVVAAAAKAGCKIVGLTGRNNAQRVATLDNLARYYHDKDGNPRFKSAFYFTKWTSTDTPPAYVDCTTDGNPACSTVEYKSSTRKYVQDKLGLHIVANFGDQFSDLIGGSSDRAVKLPNPTYYLP